ncbi:MAG: type II toxin-antitoxin system RelE/ParE family toxin [Candidatus Bathyarchaeia archaeon]|jgi:mRNA-degrading endonuclease RelE of RelBE toxin-antitoxin system
MVEIKFIVPTDKFERDVRRIRDKSLKEKLQKQIDKVADNPNFGKHLRYGLKGEWCIYVKPFRLIYKVEGDKLILLRFEHRKDAYER